MTARWEQRFENFERALSVLVRAGEQYRSKPMNDLEQAGLIQHFEMTWELGWKVMRDFLAAEGKRLRVATPAAVIRAAFEAGLVDDGDEWMEAMRLRNSLSHEYDQERALKAIDDIVHRYLALFAALADTLRDAAAPDDRPDR